MRKMAGRALFSANLSRDDDARLLRQPLQSFEGFGIFLEGADTLDDAGAIAKNGKHQFARFAQIVKPSANGDFLPVVLTSLFDAYGRHSPLYR
jgi:hypothetical protein